MKGDSKGFTLIELLVVIAIIGVLSSVVLASLNSARARANNAKRQADIKQIQSALELYYNDHGQYPVQASWRGTTPYCYGTGSDPSTAIPGLVPNYISALPQDPKSSGQYYCYLYISNGVGYKVLVNNTVEGGNVPPDHPLSRFPTGCSNAAAHPSYAVSTPPYTCS